MSDSHQDSGQYEPKSPIVLADPVSKSVKRSACDRCHVQKLSCRRQDSSDDSCARCVRAGTICVYGPTLRASRINKSGKSGGTRRKDSCQPSDQLGGSDAHQPQKGSKRLRETSPASARAATVPEDLSTSSHQRAFASPGTPDWSSWVGSTPAFDFSGSSFAIPDLDWQQPLDAAVCQGAISSGLNDPFHSTKPLDHTPHIAGDQISENVEPNSPSLTTGECIQKLSALHVSLYEHLRAAPSSTASTNSSVGSTHVSSSSASPSMLRGSSSRFTTEDSIASEELGSIMASSQHLLETLRCLRLNNYTMDGLTNTEISDRTHSPLDPGSGLLPRSRTSSTASFPLGIREESGRISITQNDNPHQHKPDNATILLVLSCYMRLLYVYTQLVDQLHQRLRDGLSVSLPPCIPYIGSVSMPFTSNLHAVFLLQLLAHLFENGSKSVRAYAEGSMEGVLGARELHDAEWDLRDKLKRCKAELKDSSIL